MMNSNDIVDCLSSHINNLSRHEVAYCTIFIVLTIITVFRRKLSSNNDYRNTNTDTLLDSRRRTRANASIVKVIVRKLKHTLFSFVYRYKVDVFVDNTKKYAKLLKQHIHTDVVVNIDGAGTSIDDIKVDDTTTKSQHKTEIDSVANKFVSSASSVATSVVTSGGKSQQYSGNLSLFPLPIDLQLLIIRYLTMADIARISILSRTLALEIRNDFIWERLWIENYGKTVWNHELVKKIRMKRNIHWDPMQNWGPPQQGWYEFYIEFEYCWINWLLAGLCTADCCMVSLYGGIYDITKFVGEHPGSQETLLDAAGCDATEIFTDIGHSKFAISISEAFLGWSPSPALTNFVSFNYIDHNDSSNSKSRSNSRNNSKDFNHIMASNNNSSSGSSSSSSGSSVGSINKMDRRKIQWYDIFPFTSIQIQMQHESEEAVRQASRRRHYISDTITDTITDGISNISSSSGIELLEKTISIVSSKTTTISSGNSSSSNSPRITANRKEKRKYHKSMITKMTNCEGYVQCCSTSGGSTYISDDNTLDNDDIHCGQMKVFYDPLVQEWWCWRTCCGVGHAIDIKRT